MECDEEVFSNCVLVLRDLLGRGGDAEAGSDRVVEEEEAEEAVPGAWIGCEKWGFVGRDIGGSNTPGAELEEVSDQGGAAGAALEPDEEGGLRERGGGVLGFVEGVEDGGAGGGADREVAGFCGEGFFRQGSCRGCVRVKQDEGEDEEC